MNLGVSYLGITGYPWRSFVSEIGGQFGGSTYFQFIRGVDYPTTNAAGQNYREAQAHAADRAAREASWSISATC